MSARAGVAKAGLRSIAAAVAWTAGCALFVCFGAPSVLPQATSAAPAVQPIPLTPKTSQAITSQPGSYSAKVTDASWVPTGVLVSAGQQLTFSATGTLSLSDGRSVTPVGVSRGWKDLLRIFPLNTANAGALIGRIGSGDAAVPFAIGDHLEIAAPIGGEISLAANLSQDLTADGSYAVRIKVAKPETKPAASSAAVASEPAITSIVSPALFNNIPRRVHDQQGDPGDMVNFAIIGSEQQVKNAFKAAAWVAVDKTTQDALIHGLEATLSHEAYVAMPMSTLYLFGRPQDMSYARADPLEVAAIRNHLRLWKSPETVNGEPLWVGSATHDNGFETDQRNGGVTHHIDPKIDTERDFIEQSFADAGVLAAAAYVTPKDAVSSARTATGGGFETDGRIVVMLLK